VKQAIFIKSFENFVKENLSNYIKGVQKMLTFFKLLLLSLQRPTVDGAHITGKLVGSGFRNGKYHC
jgi:hypothetical protein